MATPATAMRRRVADRIAAAYVGVGAKAVLLGGSTARGEADRHSDIELGVFWEAAPTDAQRADAITSAGGDLHRLWPYAEADRAWFDDWFVGRRNGEPKSGIVVEPVHMTIDDVEVVLRELLERFDPSLEKQVLAAALHDGVPLTRDPLLPEWRAIVRTYPDGLARAVVERYARIEHSWRFAAFRDRRNLMRRFEQTVAVHEGVLHALLAVNRVYWYGFKYLESLVARFAHAPRDLLPRLEHAYRAGDDELEPLLTDLVEETYDLVERYVPGADVERLRALFRYRRPLWDADPPAVP